MGEYTNYIGLAIDRKVSEGELLTSLHENRIDGLQYEKIKKVLRSSWGGEFIVMTPQKAILKNELFKRTIFFFY